MSPGWIGSVMLSARTGMFSALALASCLLSSATGVPAKTTASGRMSSPLSKAAAASSAPVPTGITSARHPSARAPSTTPWFFTWPVPVGLSTTAIILSVGGVLDSGASSRMPLGLRSTFDTSAWAAWAAISASPDVPVWPPLPPSDAPPLHAVTRKTAVAAPATNRNPLCLRVRPNRDLVKIRARSASPPRLLFK